MTALDKCICRSQIGKIFLTNCVCCSLSLALCFRIKLDSVRSSDISSVTIDRMMDRNRRLQIPVCRMLENHLDEIEQVDAGMARSLERPNNGLRGSSNNNVQPIVTQVAFRRVSTTEPDGIMRPSSSSSSSSSSTTEDVIFDDVLQILFHQIHILRHVYLISELDSCDEEYKRPGPKALSEFVEEDISKNDIFAPAACFLVRNSSLMFLSDEQREESVVVKRSIFIISFCEVFHKTLGTVLLGANIIM